MPVIDTQINERTLAAYKQISFESLVAAWLMSAGWEVLIPSIDHGMKTDLVIADGSSYYRIQVKSVESSDEEIIVENKWKGSKIDYVIYFSRSGLWGYIVPAFEQCRKRLNAPDHIRFHNNQINFLKAFKKI